MRLFAAVEFPDAVKDQLVALKTDIPGAAWVKRPALHLTLRFLGDPIDPIRLTPIKLALASVQSDAFTLTLRGVGRFPENARRPARVLWVGIEAQPALLALHQAVESALAEADFPPEDRAFSPHVTLARLKGGDGEPQASQVARFIENHKAFHSAAIPITAFHLFSSVLTPQGPRYTDEATIGLH